MRDRIQKLLSILGLKCNKISVTSSYAYIEIEIDQEDLGFLSSFESKFRKHVTSDYLSIETFISENRYITIKVSLS